VFRLRDLEEEGAGGVERGLASRRGWICRMVSIIPPSRSTIEVSGEKEPGDVRTIFGYKGG